MMYIFFITTNRLLSEFEKLAWKIKISETVLYFWATPFHFILYPSQLHIIRVSTADTPTRETRQLVRLPRPCRLVRQAGHFSVSKHLRETRFSTCVKRHANSRNTKLSQNRPICSLKIRNLT
jgi:hypothetical protein